MIPNSSLTNFYIKLTGERSLLSIAQTNILSNFERISRVRTHTYLSNNAQDEYGISQNFGEERYYTWNDTIIDCRHCPNLVDENMLLEMDESLARSKKFRRLKTDLEIRLGGLVDIEPFHTVRLGRDNTRFDIRSSAIDDFDIIRMGIKLKSIDEETFKQGLQVLADHENPFKMDRHILKPHPMVQA